MADVEQIEGFITAMRVKSTRYGFAHTFVLGSREFVAFREEEASEFAAGDYVRFQASRKKTRHRGRSYVAIERDSLELVTPAEEAATQGGFVYVLTNRSLRGLVKVGFTTNEPSQRVRELSGATGVPTPFKLEWSLPITGDPARVERAAHALLNGKRHGKEFFRIEVAPAIDAVRQAYAQVYPERRGSEDEALERHRERARLRLVQDRERIKQRREREAFNQSALGRWLANGSVRCKFGEIAVPRYRPRGWFSQLVRGDPTDWLRVTLQPNTAQEYSLRIEGLSENQPIDHALLCAPADLPKVFERLRAYLVLFAPRELEVSLSFSSKAVEVPTPTESSINLNAVDLGTPSTVKLAGAGALDLSFLAASYPASDNQRQQLRGRFVTLLETANPRHEILTQGVVKPLTSVAVNLANTPATTIAQDYGDPAEHRQRLLAAGVPIDQIDTMFKGRT